MSPSRQSPVRATRSSGTAHGFVPFVERPMGVRSEAGILRAVVTDAGRGTESAVAEALQDRGVEVLPLVDLLTDVLAIPAVREALAKQQVLTEATSPAAARRMVATLADLPHDAVARMLLDGVPARDLDASARSPERAHFLLPPLPAARSMRQPVLAVGAHPLPALAGSGEVRRAVGVITAIGRFHPRFAAARPRHYRADPGLRRRDATVDGDDVQLAPDGSVLVAVGRRTTLHGVRQLALTLLPAGVPRILVVELPRGPFDRLDRMIAVLGARTALLAPEALADDVAAWELRLSDGESLVTGARRPFRALLPEVFPGGIDVSAAPSGARASGPQHYLALEPGAVLTDAPPADPTSVALERCGVEVRAVPDERGRIARAGGIRRVVLPVQRDALPRSA